MKDKDKGSETGRQGTDTTPVPLLEAISSRGRVWEDLAEQYGVTNPDPPWKITLDATCDLLAAGSCVLPVLERRAEEDDLSATNYADIPFPERQLLALAHSLIRRGLLDEDELARRMEEVNRRLNS